MRPGTRRILKASLRGSLLATMILTAAVFVLTSGPQAAGADLIVPDAAGFAFIAFFGGLAVGIPASILCLSGAIIVSRGKLPLDRSWPAGTGLGGVAGAAILLLAALVFGGGLSAPWAAIGALYGGCVGLCWALRPRELKING